MECLIQMGIILCDHNFKGDFFQSVNKIHGSSCESYLQLFIKKKTIIIIIKKEHFLFSMLDFFRV